MRYFLLYLIAAAATLLLVILMLGIEGGYRPADWVRPLL